MNLFQVLEVKVELQKDAEYLSKTSQYKFIKDIHLKTMANLRVA